MMLESITDYLVSEGLPAHYMSVCDSEYIAVDGPYGNILVELWYDGESLIIFRYDMEEYVLLADPDSLVKLVRILRKSLYA